MILKMIILKSLKFIKLIKILFFKSLFLFITYELYRYRYIYRYRNEINI